MPDCMTQYENNLKINLTQITFFVNSGTNEYKNSR